MKTAFLFPGQGSQQVGMGKDLSDKWPVARLVFEEADRVLGMRLSSLCFEGPDEELRLTVNTQPAMLTASIAALRVLEQRGARADFLAGHSLGEYSALVAAESLKFDDALRAVRKRGLYMQEAVPTGEGAMAALIGLDIHVVNSICMEASRLGVCAPANLNSPTQTVVAGARHAGGNAGWFGKKRGAKRDGIRSVGAAVQTAATQPAAEKPQA